MTVTVELGDGTVATSTAWVIAGPPDFAPGIMNLVTLYDLLFDYGVKRGLLKGPADDPSDVSFVRHVKPILDRTLGYRWVNRAAAFGYDNRGTGHGPGGAGDFSRHWPALADPSPASEALRASLASRLRNPDRRAPLPAMNPLELVPRLSDHEWFGSGPGNVLPLTLTQYQIMQAWGRGEFVNDLGKPVATTELLPDAITRVALEACVGAPLYPGIEVNGTIMNFPERFLEGEPFRISHAAVKPGEVTQYNCVPWQADFLYCRWEESRGLDLKRLGWWPAQRPDDVFRAPAPPKWCRGARPWSRLPGNDRPLGPAGPGRRSRTGRRSELRRG